jgi:hypothetical protein
MDATVRFINSRHVNEKTIRALITRSGGETIDFYKIER